MKYFRLTLLMLLAHPIWLAAQQEQETIVVFTQPEDTHFRKSVLIELRKFAAENEIMLLERDAGQGLPPEITTTPAIVYQGLRGRAIYASRYAEFSTIVNFVRTNRFATQHVIRWTRKNCLVKKMGRSTLYVPFKVTPLTGKVPRGFLQEEFRTEIQETIAGGMAGFQWTEEALVYKTDRAFYLDIHPYLDASGNLYLSLEIYSQFNCRNPVFSKMEMPLTGNFNKRHDLLLRAGALVEKEIVRQMKESKIGDAFTAVAKRTPESTWDNLLPPVTKTLSGGREQPVKLEELPTDWTFYRALDDKTPIVAFHFQAPLDRYAGEVREISGKLNFTSDFSSISGQFEAQMQSLTMGMKSFDENVLTKYIKAFRFPKAHFTFDSPLILPPLGFGQTMEAEVPGTLELMRKKRLVKVKALISPIQDDSGQIFLLVNVTFRLNIVDDFKIKGPDGPAPASKTVLFDLNFLMKESNL